MAAATLKNNGKSIRLQILGSLGSSEPSADSSGLWAYLNQTTLYLNQADSFVQNGTTLEVQYE